MRTDEPRTDKPPTDEPPNRPGRRRQIATIALCTLGCLLCVASVSARWLRGEILDTDRYLGTVAPLAGNPTLQDAVATQVAQAVSKRLSPDAQNDMPGPLADILSGPISAGVEKATYRITLDFVRSDAFSAIWTAANRTAHQQLVAVLRGRPGSVVAVDSHGLLTIELNPVVVALAHQLADLGVAPEQLDSLTVTMPVATVGDIGRARQAARWLTRAAFWLPPLALATITGAVLTAVDRRRMLVIVGLGVAAAMAALGAALAVWLPGTVTDGIGDHRLRKAATAVLDQLTVPLRDEIRTTAVAGLVTAGAGTVLLMAAGRRAPTTLSPAGPP
ncbi:hypothetical protein CcI49_13805 [Frankia sp. CcI49]|nr:hypothetical protein CcI49_13805 [Frankia sp. CcI49]